MKKIICLFIVMTFISIPTVQAVQSGPATPEIAQRTQWFSDAVYGIDGISPPLDINVAGRKEGESWNDMMMRFDVDAMVNEAVETGAGFLTFTMGWGYYSVPFAPYEQYLGLTPGDVTSKRDLLEEVYQKASVHGIKILVYITGDAAVKRPDLQSALGFGTNEFFPRWFSMVKWLSDKYGDKIDGWWVDGAYDSIGYNDSRLLDFSAALRSGNPNAIVCFNNGLGPNAFDYRCGADFTAGELYGLSLLPDERFKNGLQWSTFVPMSFQYGQVSSAFTTNEIVQYVQNVRAKGGVAYFWIADRTWDLKTDATSFSNKIQIEQLKTLKKVIRDNAPYDPCEAFNKPYENIEAEDCIEMKSTPNMTGNKLEGALLYSIGNLGTFYQSNIKNTWAKYSNVNLPNGATKFSANVRKSLNWYYSETDEYRPMNSTGVTMEVRIGGINGEVIANVGNYNEFDNFNFSSENDTTPLRPKISNFRQVSTDINLPNGKYDIYITFKGENYDDTLTDTQVLEEEYLQKAQYTKEPWLYNKSLSIAYNAPNEYYQNKFFKKLAEIKPTINFRTTPIRATEKLYAREFSQRRAVYGDDMQIVKEENSSPKGEYMIHLYRDDWIMFKDVDFGQGSDTFYTSFVVGKGFGGSKMHIYIDNIYDSSKKIGTHTISESPDWSNFTLRSSPIKQTSGIHNVYIKFEPYALTCGNLEYISFNEIPYELSHTVKYTQNGVENGILQQGAIDINVDMTNFQNVDRDLTLYSVLYNKKKNQIVDITSQRVTLLKNTGNEKVTKQLQIPENPKDYMVKIFALDNITEMKPYNILKTINGEWQ